MKEEVTVKINWSITEADEKEINRKQTGKRWTFSHLDLLVGPYS